jgi:FAD/FMN-containing dehydrogenase
MTAIVAGATSTIAARDQRERAHASELLARLHDIVGAERLITTDDARRLRALDFSEEPGAVPLAVIEPVSTDEVARIVAAAAEHATALVVRGGGMSYTRAHLAAAEPTVMIDMRRMDAVIELNRDDLYVTVQTGITWTKLRRALRDTGLRLPFFGTLSGDYAQIGGGLAQNSAGLGKGHLAEHVRSLEVVLGDGRVVRTGSDAAAGTGPFTRHYGPDLTGLFLSESGALGIKTAATLALEVEPGGTSFGCWAFDEARDLVGAEVEIARRGLAVECIAFDRYLARAMTRMPPPPRGEMWAMGRAYVAKSSSRLRAVRQLLRAARPGGLKFLEGVAFVLSAVTDAFDQAASDRQLAAIDRIARRRGGRPLPPAIPLGMRYGPLPPIADLMIGLDGESNFPSNIIVPLSKAERAVEMLDRFFAEHAEEMRVNGIFEARNYLAFGNCFGIEPILYWRSRPNAWRLSFVRDERKRRELEAIPENPAAVAAAVALRHAMIDRLRDVGAVQIQLGKLYPYRSSLGGVAWQILEAVKNHVDPARLMNPGALGLD